MRDADFGTLGRPGQAAILAACLLAGAALGFIGTFCHQALPPVGLTLALLTVTLLIGGLRLWGGVRGPAAAASAGVALVSWVLTSSSGSSVLVPANAVGYAWLVGILAIAFVALAWPNIHRARPSGRGVPPTTQVAPDTIEHTPEEKDRAQP